MAYSEENKFIERNWIKNRKRAAVSYLETSYRRKVSVICGALQRCWLHTLLSRAMLRGQINSLGGITK
jgi:hypothetical protein